MPSPAVITFHGALQDLVASGNRGPGAGRVDYPVTRRASIKDVIEALGPPHTEVGRIEVNGADADFGHLLLPGQAVDVHPVALPMDVTAPDRLRPRPLARLAFVVDVNVGALARRLRLLGLDAAFDPAWDDRRVAALAREQGRVVLTGDRLLLRRNEVVFGRLVRASDPDLQLLETLEFFGLRGPFRIFSRCPRCNQPLGPIAKNLILHRLEPLTRRHYQNFHICPGCSRIYWPGSHHDRIMERLEKLGLLGPGH